MLRFVQCATFVFANLDPTSSMYRDTFEILSAEVFKTIVEQSSDAVLLFTSQAQLFFANEQAKAILNLHTAHLNLHASELLPELLYKQLTQRESIGPDSVEFPCAEIEACDAGFEWLESTVNHFQIGETRFQQMTLKDVTRSKQKESVLIQQATTDDLSGLSNRRCFRKILDDHGHKQLALAIVDVDHFKSINDKFGHLTGDNAIRFVAGKLLEHFNDALCVSRLGGEEFAVVLKMNDKDSVASQFESYRIALQNEPMAQNGHRITASIGLAFSDECQFDVGLLLHRADKALYSSKTSGRNRVTVFGR